MDNMAVKFVKEGETKLEKRFEIPHGLDCPSAYEIVKAYETELSDCEMLAFVNGEAFVPPGPTEKPLLADVKVTSEKKDGSTEERDFTCVADMSFHKFVQFLTEYINEKQDYKTTVVSRNEHGSTVTDTCTTRFVKRYTLADLLALEAEEKRKG